MIPETVQKSLLNLFNSELELAKRTEILKQKLALCYDFDAKTLYEAIDDGNVKFIDNSSLKRFFAKTKVYPQDNLLVAIIRRIDLDADSRLS